MSSNPFDTESLCAMTLTAGGAAENHTGMQKIGEQRSRGFTPKDLIYLHRRYSGVLHKLDNEAYVWIQDIETIFGVTHSDLYNEHDALEVDKKKKMYGRVVNAKARYNLCYGDTAQNSSIENGRGTVIAFEDVPLLNTIRKRIPEVFKTDDGPDLNNLMFELNKYYDPKNCGIGFHGDTERRIVIGFRLGKRIPLEFQAFKNTTPFGNRIKVRVKGGQFYIMSEKAVGFDWKNKNILTWRHAAGAKKYRPSNEDIVNKKNKKRKRGTKLSKKESKLINDLCRFVAKHKRVSTIPAEVQEEVPIYYAEENEEETLTSAYNEDPVTFKCVQCGIDMGKDNPRQLCAKTHCATQMLD